MGVGRGKGPGRPKVNIHQRLRENKLVDPVTGCWIWQGAKNRSGHGATQYNGKVREVHRVAFEIYVAMPKNLVLHKCGSPACYNPEHLYDGTYSDNLKDAYNKGER